MSAVFCNGTEFTIDTLHGFEFINAIKDGSNKEAKIAVCVVKHELVKHEAHESYEHFTSSYLPKNPIVFWQFLKSQKCAFADCDFADLALLAAALGANAIVMDKLYQWIRKHVLDHQKVLAWSAFRHEVFPLRYHFIGDVPTLISNADFFIAHNAKMRLTGSSPIPDFVHPDLWSLLPKIQIFGNVFTSFVHHAPFRAKISGVCVKCTSANRSLLFAVLHKNKFIITYREQRWNAISTHSKYLSIFLYPGGELFSRQVEILNITSDGECQYSESCISLKDWKEKGDVSVDNIRRHFMHGFPLKQDTAISETQILEALQKHELIVQIPEFPEQSQEFRYQMGCTYLKNTGFELFNTEATFLESFH